MDIGTIIIGTIFLVLCLVPFVLMGGSTKKRNKRLGQGLQEMASKHNGRITSHECCGDFAIGLDEISHFAFFYKKIKDKEVSKSVDLKNIKESKVINTSRSIKSGNGDYKTLERLEIAFVPNLEKNPDMIWELFNMDDNMQQRGEVLFASHWSEKINDLLRQKN